MKGEIKNMEKEVKQVTIRTAILGDSQPTVVIGKIWESGEGYDLFLVGPNGKSQTLEVPWALHEAITTIGTLFNGGIADVKIEYDE